MILASGLAAILTLRGGGVFSPGPLGAAPAGADAGAAFPDHAAFEAECGRCHAPWQGVTADRCQACHEHVGQERARGTGLHGLLPETGRCATCHPDHRGPAAALTQMPEDFFDHELLSSFSLARHQAGYDGRPLSCTACHRPADAGAEPARLDCSACHEEAAPVFMAEHTGLFGRECLACHDGVDRMAAFDHEAIYPLVGAHATATCAGCHRGQLFPDTPRECSACHEEPAVHAGLFGLECARCHGAVAWAPAQLTRHTFPLDHGEEGEQACAVCHEETYTAYTCYNCHEHGREEIREEHLDEGIDDFAACAECHPGGQL